MNLTSTPMTHAGDISEEQLTVINQTKAHPIRTDKYSVVTTQNILSQLEESGLTWTKVAEERNTPKYKGFGTHLIRCTHPSFSLGKDENMKELIPQLYIKNSYHGRTCLELHLGLFDVFTMKGFILGNRFAVVKVKHIGLTKSEVEELVNEMEDKFVGEVAPFILSLKETKVGKREQIQVAEAILKERVRTNPNFLKGEHEKLLGGLPVDASGQASLWNLMETVKDNCGLEFRSKPAVIRYEITGKDKDGNEVLKERKLSKLTNIQSVTYMNKYLFDLISSYLPSK